MSVTSLTLSHTRTHTASVPIGPTGWLFPACTARTGPARHTRAPWVGRGPRAEWCDGYGSPRRVSPSAPPTPASEAGAARGLQLLLCSRRDWIPAECGGASAPSSCRLSPSRVSGAAASGSLQSPVRWPRPPTPFHGGGGGTLREERGKNCPKAPGQAGAVTRPEPQSPGFLSRVLFAAWC